ncbi:MPPV-234 N1R/p28-like protein [Magpiepox virus 2]|nr:MPPV-234 N1R/p28-like protein [Magpiepox virus 2]
MLRLLNPLSYWYYEYLLGSSYFIFLIALIFWFYLYIYFRY